jgi:hypothetical protein
MRFCWLTFWVFACVLAAATGSVGAKLFTRITAEDGSVQYDLKANEGNGWYTEIGSDYRFKVGFKQGERASKDPVLVATLKTTDAEHYRGTHALEFQIDARTETRSKGAAYKVALASFKPKDPFSPSVLEARDWYHGFAMKIDPSNYKLPEDPGQELTFEQFHQGSPFHPPIALIIANERDAKDQGWKDAGKDGNFALRLIDDDHGPLNTLPGKPQYYDLGPVTTGKWISWVVRVRPSPVKPEGAVSVSMDGVVKLDLANIKVGYDRQNPQYTSHKPPTFFDYADVLVYRVNGDNFQRFFFDEIRFADTLEDASSPPGDANLSSGERSLQRLGGQ